MKKNYNLKGICFLAALCFSAFSIAQILADGTYKILNTVNNEVMTVNTVPPVNMGDIIVGRAKMAPVDSNDNLQLWSFVHQGNDIYRVSNVGDNTSLGIKDGWCGTFGDVQVGFSNTDPFALFKLTPAGTTAGTFTIEIGFDANCNFGSMNTPIKAFDVDGGNAGAKIQTFDRNAANPNQQFMIVDPVTLSNASLQAVNAFKVFFNRAERTVNLAATSDDIITKIEILDLNGRVVDTAVNIQPENVRLNANTIGNGLYFVRITEDLRTTVQKVIIY